MKQIHPIQMKILKKLLFASDLRFSDIKPKKSMENNQFVFHLDQMIHEGLIVKEDKVYRLTNKGKEFANRMDTEVTKILPQAKIGAIVMPMRGPKSNREFLIYTRLKQPFYGCQGFMSGKVKYGEQVVQAAQREFKEETNLDGAVQIVGLKHFHVYDATSNELVEDKFLFYCVVKNPTGNLVPNNEGKYEWVKRADLQTYVTNHFETIEVLFDDIKIAENSDGHMQFVELTHVSEKF
jgi:8-oxo-dGTP pyrophosphatase MutT (NUDIX family)